MFCLVRQNIKSCDQWRRNHSDDWAQCLTKNSDSSDIQYRDLTSDNSHRKLRSRPLRWSLPSNVRLIWRSIVELIDSKMNLLMTWTSLPMTSFLLLFCQIIVAFGRQLTKEDFDEILGSNYYLFVKFYAPKYAYNSWSCFPIDSTNKKLFRVNRFSVII